MTKHHVLRISGLVLALAITATLSRTVDAGLFNVNVHSLEAAKPKTQTVANTTAVVQPDCATPAKCCTPCITYHECGCRKTCCNSAPDIQMILQVQDPRSCCTVEVPVCVPACCQGTPCVSSRCALFCRGVVWYDWDCGFSVKVVFKHCGDLVVTYVN